MSIDLLFDFSLIKKLVVVCLDGLFLVAPTVLYNFFPDRSCIELGGFEVAVNRDLRLWKIKDSSLILFLQEK